MTPQTATANVTEAKEVALTQRDTAESAVAAAPLARLLEPQSWSRVRLAVDTIVLYLAASFALLILGQGAVTADDLVMTT
ncbi:MAG: hypothetical protein JO372_02340, partial [Solirubrobacterales bacterium]|nr:hypothetical protein [Solirubrobacterales bacterium]